MDKELYDKLGTKRERTYAPAGKDDICKKCGAILLGTLSGRQLPAGESTENNNGYAFIVTPYCPRCG